MKSKLFFIGLLSILLLSCDKIEQTQKHLSGTWNIIEYEFLNHNGLHYFYDAEGTMSFGNCSDKTCDYSLDVNYVTQGNQYEKIESGNMEFQDEEYFVMNRSNTDGTTTLIEYARIVVITNDDLKLIFTDEDGAHEFILQK